MQPSQSRKKLVTQWGMLLLALLLLAVIAAIFSALLFIGPPGGWPQD